MEIALTFDVPQPLLGVGAHLKNCVALAWERRAVVSPHIGTLESPRALAVFERTIEDLQQMFVVQRGVVDVELYTDDRRLFREIRLQPGDAIVLIHGIHAIRVVEDFQALSVKQGPFLGDEEDKVLVEPR